MSPAAAAACVVALCLQGALVPAGAAALRGRGAARQGVLQSVTPMQKVLELLKNLQSQLEEESKDEAAAYDKFACFCKEQLDKKVYVITKSFKKIHKLKARINQLATEVGEHDTEIGELSEAITALGEEIQEATEVRERGHSEYVEEEADVSAAISALQRAIEAMEGSKDKMTDAKYDLLQLQGLADALLTAASRGKKSPASQEQLDAVASLAQIAQDPTVYEYKSSAILATLEDMLKVFLEKKKDIDTQEFDQQAEYDKSVLDLKNMKKFHEKDRAKLEKFVAMKTEQKEDAIADLLAENSDMEKDGAFLGELKGECEEKAKLWDQRSKMRASELQSVAKALNILESEVAPKYSVNEKVVDLQLPRASRPVRQPAALAGPAAAVRPAVANAAREAPAAASLLQLEDASAASSGEALRVQATRKAVRFLTEAAGTLRSSALVAAAGRVAAAKDHFVKVRTIIRDLMAKLEADAEAEATQKSFCDESMAKSTDARDRAQSYIEELTATKHREETLIPKLEEEIAELSQDIADLKKQLNEATQLRQEDSDENKRKRGTAKEGEAAVDMALSVLNQFYSSAATALIQKKFEPEGGDREGNTVSDSAPEVFGDNYRGDQSSSKGIIGLLEVIMEDFVRTYDTLEVEEMQAEEEYDALKRDIEAAIKSKSESKEGKEERVKSGKVTLVETEDDLEEQNGLLDTAKDTLQQLKKQCVDGEETYEERVADRKKEIEALKHAHAVLEDWQA